MRIKLLTALAVTAMTAQAGPVVRWLETEHNFGAFDESVGVVRCVFKAVNDGDEPLVVINARANCGCTRPSYSNEAVNPGDTLRVTVGYDPEGRPGRFTKYIKVNTNGEPRNSELAIHGTVIGASNTLKGRFPIDVAPAKMRDKVIPYGEVFKGKIVGGYVEGYNTSRDTIAPRVENLPPYLAARVEPARVAPGEQFIVSTTLYSSKVPDWGIVTGEFDLIPDTDSNRRLNMSVVAIVKEDFGDMTPQERIDAPTAAIAPVKIDMGRIDKASSQQLRGSFTITNNGKNPLSIRAIKCTDPAVTLKFKDTRLKRGKSMKVDVTVTPSLIDNPEMLNARITVITNDPDNATRTVRVIGEIEK